MDSQTEQDHLCDTQTGGHHVQHYSVGYLVGCGSFIGERAQQERYSVDGT
jgi:hypothetical protein